MAASIALAYKTWMRPPRLLFAWLTLAVGIFAGGAAHADDFWRHWGDGKAELDGYALTQPRYGQKREGAAVLIFVTEDFSDSLRVKADPGKHPPSDVYPVLKLNFVREFQTGIYRYAILSSTFARTEPVGGAPWTLAKTSFSSQEWCGHVYQQWLPRRGLLEGTVHSYFDGEADERPILTYPPGGLVEEEVPILIRELRGPWLRPGESRAVPFLPSALRARLQHQKSAWSEAVVRRSEGTELAASVLGKIAAYTYAIEPRGGPVTTWTVEAAPPHRILGWRASDGESGRLTGSERLPYWTLHDEGDEKYLAPLGLTPLPRPAAKAAAKAAAPGAERR